MRIKSENTADSNFTYLSSKLSDLHQHLEALLISKDPVPSPAASLSFQGPHRYLQNILELVCWCAANCYHNQD